MSDTTRSDLKQHGQWTILEYLPDGLVRARCSCGTVRTPQLGSLLNGKSRSCGCARKLSEEKIRERFWSKVHRGATPQACWIWTGGCHKKSKIPYFSIGEEQVTATVFMYQLSGRERVEHTNVRRVCKNPLCVNPRHLVSLGNEPVEEIERMQEAWARSTAARKVEDPATVAREAIPSSEHPQVPLLKDFLLTNVEFWSKVKVSADAECWPWTGSMTDDGYGRFYVRGEDVTRIAPRLAYEFATGRPLGELQACHRCDNRACCNPRHIFGASLQANMADKRLKGRSAAGSTNWKHLYPELQKRGLAHHRSVLSPDQVRRIRAMRKDGAAERAIAAEVGCSRGAIQGVIRGITYTDVI